MKKLLFATAIAASAAAFADPINAISFENSQYAVIDNATNLTGKADIPDPGRESETGATGTYFLYTGDGSDSSIVTNVGAAFTDKGTAYFAGLMENEDFPNQKYLALDTEGGTLWRSINTIGTGALGEARAVAATGTYLDTLVQFTVTEDDAPTVGADDKLAIWLQAGEGVTNLMVRAGLTDASGGITPTNFTLNATVNPNEWYRLTIKALEDITDNEGIPGFQIYLDGTLLTSSTPTLTSGYLEILGPDDVDDSHYADLVAGKYFASLKTGTTLQGVGFQGTGAVDEIVWTEEDPFPAAVVEFTLTYSGDANVTLGAVTYTIGDDPTAQTPTEGKIPEGAEVSIAAPTFAAGYQLAAFTVDGTAETVASWPYTFTMTADKTVSITSAQITYALTLPVVANATAAVTADGTPVPNLAAIPAGTAIVVTWTVTDPDYEITVGGTQNITMDSNVTANTPTVVKKANWVDVSSITAGTKASEQYPSLAGTAVANADAAQLTTWATGVGNVSFKDAGDDDINVDAFLLNIANDSTAEQIAAEKEEFVANITINADGTPVVTTPTGKTYNGKLQLKAKVNLADTTWTPVEAASTTYKFYMYELSLPAAE